MDPLWFFDSCRAYMPHLLTESCFKSIRTLPWFISNRPTNFDFPSQILHWTKQGTKWR